MVTPSDRLLLSDARAVIGTVSEHLFFCRDPAVLLSLGCSQNDGCHPQRPW